MTSIILLVCMLIAGSTAADPAVGANAFPTFKVYINNNPAFKGESIHGSPVENAPSIRIEADGITQDGKVRVEVMDRNADVLLAKESSVSGRNGSFALEFRLPEPLKDPDCTRITFEAVNAIVKAELPAKLHRIHGTVTNLKGEPVQAVLIVSWDIDQAVRARAGRNGDYEIWLPEEKVGHIFVDDETYGKTSLESFIGHNFTLKSDLKLDIQIDRMELYNLRSWATLSTFYVYFVPMSLPRLQNKTLDGTRKAWPALSADDVKITVNGKESAVRQIEEVKDFIGGGGDDWRPAYLVSISLSEILEAQRTRNEIFVRVRAADRPTGAHGEAFLINPSID